MDNITFDQFKELDIRIAKIIRVEEIDGADKLLKLTLDVGSVDDGGLGERIIAAGIKEHYSPAELKGKLIVYLSNLEPRTIRGVESQGMLMAATPSPQATAREPDDRRPILLQPEKDAKPGSIVR